MVPIELATLKTLLGRFPASRATGANILYCSTEVIY
jgi:hypothetical protein